MSLNCVEKIIRSSVVEEENPLPKAPQRCGSEFIGAGVALNHVICQAGSHVVHQQIRKKIRRLVTQGRNRRHAGDRKSTRLNSSHTVISYAVFCLKKKTK